MFDYDGWASFGIGSSVTWEEDSHSRRRMPPLPEPLTAEQKEKMASILPPEQVEMILKGEMSIRILSENRATLVERHPDRLVLEIRTRVTTQGHRQESTHREELHAVPPPAAPDVLVVSSWESEDGSESGTVEKHSWSDLFKGAPTVEGDETIEVMGMPMRCRWSEQSAPTPVGLFQVRTWRCNEIPGGIVRVSLRMEGAGEQKSSDTRVLSYDRKELRSAP